MLTKALGRLFLAIERHGRDSVRNALITCGIAVTAYGHGSHSPD
ncbi:hypothetical protein SBD_7706 [Streptomyces bottropensis ATCC 25435]|uniref:Uncharacterized protein n=1 Tax=Streptomyces bottropensis ATCC 25435 TaxID=1054862 RepID=M3FG50_9ACTN|nr:hypothetical protein SBD_7706 [Streptomyces bottropensis ATCC 25435]